MLFKRTRVVVVVVLVAVAVVIVAVVVVVVVGPMFHPGRPGSARVLSARAASQGAHFQDYLDVAVLS